MVHYTRRIAQAGGSSGRGTHLPKAIADAQALAYHDVFVITAAIIVPAIILGLFPQWTGAQREGKGRERRRQVRGARERTVV